MKTSRGSIFILEKADVILKFTIYDFGFTIISIRKECDFVLFRIEIIVNLKSKIVNRKLKSELSDSQSRSKFYTVEFVQFAQTFY